ncbi:MAG: hypothetical protein V9G10_07505 [Candidatus Nanopelagicales bacterium]
MKPAAPAASAHLPGFGGTGIGALRGPDGESAAAPSAAAAPVLRQVSGIRQQLRALGARPAHEQRVLRLWAQARPQDSGRRRLRRLSAGATPRERCLG